MSKMSDDARELELFIDNEGDLYRQMTQPIQKNLINKMASGAYSPQKALKAWENLATEGAQRYCRQFCSRGAVWHKIFPVAVRREVAASMRDRFEEEAAEGEFDHLLFKKYQKNPGPKLKIHDYIGDKNPIEYGGGVVVKTDHGYEIEYTHGLDREGSDPAAMEVYRVPVEDDVYKYHDWADVDDVASSTGGEPEELLRRGRSRKIMDRVWALEDIAGYYGWYELDNYPETFTAAELAERWGL